jgi:putative nucleotidyltransferase with HDIG domain
MTSTSTSAKRLTPCGIGAVRPAADLLLTARERERAGRLDEAIERYERAIAEAEAGGEYTVLSEGLRRLAIVRHQRGEREQARGLCERSFEVARATSNDLLSGEALNTLGAMQLREGELHEARKNFLRALGLGGTSRELRARAEQNLGIIADIHGDFQNALAHYTRSLGEYQALEDEHGCAIAYHNMGLVSRAQGKMDDADQYFQRSLTIAERAGDVRLQGACLANRAEVYLRVKRFEDARKDAEESLAIFDRLGFREHKANAYKVIGTYYRETGRPALAESRLRAAIDLAVSVGSVLRQAEATRELGIVYQGMGRNQEALAMLNSAHKLFGQLDARVDLINVDGLTAELEGTYLAVVRQWGESIESSDSYTYGHCERVAENAVAVARALGLDEQEQTTIRLGAYLHDLGKVKVPHEVLNKAGPLTRDEFEVIQMHPVWGVELLSKIEFPWDIKPIIRWHHEKYDGTGYPDRLRGDEIPLAAQIVGIVDVFDALTTTRSYRAAMTTDEAAAVITKERHSWSPEVFDAFMKVLAEGQSEVDGEAASDPAAGLRAA